MLKRDTFPSCWNSIIKVNDVWGLFRIWWNLLAEETSEVKLIRSATCHLMLLGIFPPFYNISSIKHITAVAMMRPIREPIGTSSTCSYSFLSNWKSWFLVAISTSSVSSSLHMLLLCLTEPISIKTLWDFAHWYKDIWSTNFLCFIYPRKSRRCHR